MSDYLIHNQIELGVIALAVVFSKERMIPIFLVLYVTVMTITFGSNEEYLSSLDRANIGYMYYNTQAAYSYLFESAIMIALMIISIFNISKMRSISTLVIFCQMLISLVMGVYFYGYSADIFAYTEWLSVIHYYAQSIFVILYCVIAWTCVYYSRKGL